MNPADPSDVWRVMSPTSYQAAPPRDGMIAEALEFVKPTCQRRTRPGQTRWEFPNIFCAGYARPVPTTRNINSIPRGARNCLCVRSGANLLQPVTKVSWIDSRRETYGSIIFVVMKQELFGLALPAKRAADPILDGAGDHGAPKFLLGDFMVLAATT